MSRKLAQPTATAALKRASAVGFDRRPAPLLPVALPAWDRLRRRCRFALDVHMGRHWRPGEVSDPRGRQWFSESSATVMPRPACGVFPGYATVLAVKAGTRLRRACKVACGEP